MIKKIWHLLSRATKQTVRLPSYVRDYGCKVAAYIWWDRVFLGLGKERYIRVVQAFINDYLADLAEEYREKPMVLPEQPRVNTVWCCWWQGEAHMPEIVQMCVASIRAALPKNVELVLITEKNYSQYLSLPQHILKKLETKRMSITAFSDILRASLLSKYGGFWIDATVLIPTALPEEWFQRVYFTQAFGSKEDCPGEACGGKWAGFLQCGVSEFLLFAFVRDAYFKWWQDFDDLVDYVILDYFIMAAYQLIPHMRVVIDEVPVNNTQLWAMARLLPQTFDQARYEELCKTQYFNKLARTLEPPKQDEAGNPTFYGKLCQTFLAERRD